MSTTRSTPIAIVGMACILPGANSPEEFWAELLRGADLRTEGGHEVFGTGPDVPGGWGDPKHRITATRGGFVREPEIDLTGLRLSASELAGLGNVVRWPLHVARQALADAGLLTDSSDRTGLVLGNYSFPTQQSAEIVVPRIRREVSEGLGLSADVPESVVDDRNLRPFGLPATIVADALGLGGPRLALDAACSSALYSLALARDYLATGMADVMLAGAVCAPDPLLIHLSFSDLQAFPRNGISQPFDTSSAGIVTGQGAGVFVVKRLEDALRDHDRIHAVIESIGLSNDGAGKHVLTPNVSGQLDAYQQAYSSIDKSTVDYIECHATGTPVGDSTELRGLAEFFPDNPPPLGSVKGNVGHLLTVAGFTSMLKVILSMRHGVLPATPGVVESASDRVVLSERPWPRTDGLRRAGVSAFGFGGTNAHLVLSSEAPAAPTEPARTSRLALIGVGAKLGGLNNVMELDRAVRTASPAARTIDHTEIDIAAYRIPPAELNNINHQHVVLFEAAEAALTDAGFPPPAARAEHLEPVRIAVVIAMEMEPRTHTHRARFDIGAHVRAEIARSGTQLSDEAVDQLEAAVRDAVHEPIGANEVLSYIGNVMASRISASRNLTGPSFTVSAGHTSGAGALEIAGLLLLDPTIKAVLVGGVDLAYGPQHSDGAAAVVVTREDEPATKVYGTVDSIVLRHGENAVTTAAEAALTNAGISADDVDYLELGTSAELAGLAPAYRTESDDLSCAVGSVTSLIGDTRHCSVLASVVKVALCLRNAELPPTPADLVLDEVEGTPLCRLEATQPWLRRRRDGRRIAAISAADSGTAAHLVLSGSETAAHSESYVGALILSITADDSHGLAAEAGRLLSELDSGRDPLTLCREAIASTGKLTAVLVATDGERLRKELTAAERDLPNLGQGEWSTPAGSYCTGKPLGGDGRIAFVYPGAFTTYPGAGRDLFRLFPQLLADFENEADRPAERFKHRALYPRARAGFDRRALLRHEAELQEQIPVMLAAGTNFAVLHTRLLSDLLGLRPHGGFGYSLGESSMLFAMGVWESATRDDCALTATPLFRDELRGPKRLPRRTWGITHDDEIWSTHVLLADPESVRDAMNGLDRVYLTHVNTPNEVVLAGDPVQCRELISRVGCQAAKAPANHVMHCPMVDSELAELASLNTYPLGVAREGIELLSAFDYDRIDASCPNEIATRIAWTLRSPIDFTRLARTAHDRGFRYFVEVGPGATCTRWISETLGTADHVAVSMDRRGVSTSLALAQALAKLVSNGVRVDLSGLIGSGEPNGVARRTHEVRCGGESLVDRVRRAAATMKSTIIEEPPVSHHDVIAVDGDPFCHLPAQQEMTQQQVTTTATVDTSAVRAIAGTVAEAHRAMLRAQHAVQDQALRLLEQDQPVRSSGVIWDEHDLLEFARGNVGKVFGPEFAVIDTYPVRVRLPEPPYLFVSRVTELRARTGEFEPSAITTEYDIPVGAWYTVDGLAPCAMTIEAGQCDLLLISYLGIDFRNQGERLYRLLDSRLVFHGGLPREGQTLRYEIKIDRFVWNGDSLLFFFNYRCFADGELILELLDACAGFFSRTELTSSLGVVETEADRRRRASLTRTWFKPLARTDRTGLSTSDLLLLAEGHPAKVFGPEWDQSADGCNKSLRLPGEMLRMIDEIPDIDRLGGPRGLGKLSATKELDPDGWYFQCHFTGDPVLAGSLVAEGGVQLLQVYALYLGMHLVLPDAEFQSVPGLETEVKVRGQISPGTARIRYEAEITELTMLPRPTVIADILVYDGDKPIISMRNFGIQVREKPGTPYRPGAGGVPEFLGRRNRDGEAAFINELHLAHAAKGDLGTAMGPEFDVYADHRAPYIPNGDFRFVDRIMKLDGTRGALIPGAVMHTEYDSPPEAWYYKDNSFEGMPNCVHMETSLQAAILLGYYLGATLDSPDEEFSIRNLDGQATVVKPVDLRGKTIRQTSELLSSQAVTGATLQRFRYELAADGEVFYVGESLFGYFNSQALSNQVGLDAGKFVAPWLDSFAGEAVQVRRTPGMRLGEGHLHLVDQIDFVQDGGEFGKGYLFGRRRIDPADWYFECHFYRDPVMPGSLGVEAVVQALQLHVADSGLLDGFTAPVFAMPVGLPMGWKYRGQILRTDNEMTYDLHVKEIRREADRLLVIADANVWRTTESGQSLRIYQLTDVGVEVRESKEGR